MYNVNQILLEFTNNTGTDLWLDWELELADGMSSLAGFFKSSNAGTGSRRTGPDLMVYLQLVTTMPKLKHLIK